jgi:hypothetical protein
VRTKHRRLRPCCSVFLETPHEHGHRRGITHLAVADGPFAETKEQIAGFYIMECEDLDEAIEIASRNPAARYGTVEVRPVWEI